MTKRWKIFTVLALMFILGIFYRISMAVVARDISIDLGLNAAQLGVLSGIFFYVFAFVQIPLGPLIDRYGGRPMVSLLGMATTCGSLIFALAPGYYTALTGRILLGMGTACVLMGSLKVFTNWFSPQEFPKVSGFLVGSGSLGILCATSPLAQAVTRYGWRNTFLAATLLQAAVTLAVYVIVRDTPATAATEGGMDTGAMHAWRVILTTPAFWFVSLIAYFWYANYMVLLALWGGPYLMEAVGLSRAQAGNILLFTSIGFVSGSLLLGKITERLFGSLEKTLLAGQLLLLLAMTAMLGPAESFSRPLLAAVFFVIGLASSGGVIIYPLARNMVPHELAATAMTCVNFFLLMGAATGQHIMGMYISSFPRSRTATQVTGGGQHPPPVPRHRAGP
jgi:sugar phosphate permease